MNFISYCELPTNEQWITQMMYRMKLDSGYNETSLIEAVYELADLEGVLLVDSPDDDWSEFFETWYDELETPDERDFPPRSGAI